MKKSVVLLLLFAAVIFWGCGRSDIESGNICLRLGDYEMAEHFFSAALYRNPANYSARLGMGKALLQRAAVHRSESVSLWKRGLVHLEAAQSINPAEDLRPLLSDVWYRRSSQLLGKGDTTGALAALTRSIEHDPENVQALNSTGILYFRLGEHFRAKEIFKRALVIDTTYTALHFNLGMISYQSGDMSTAHSYWLSALKSSPEDQDLMYWFAVAEREMRSEVRSEE